MRTALLSLLLLITACTSEIETTYSTQRAFFRFAPTTAALPLHTALGNPGHWCTIVYDAATYTFSAPHQQNIRFPRTALEAYGTPISIGGFLIGTPALPELDGSFSLRAYDLVCPSCYRNAYIERSLSLATDGQDHATCSRCHRTYNLSTGAPENQPDDRQSQERLFRYRIAHNAAQGVVVIQN